MNKIMIAFLAGAVLGVLFAPDKGANTRKKLSDRYDELKQSLQDEANEMYAQAMNSPQEENNRF